MNIKEIKEVLQLMAEHGLTEIELEKDGLKIKLKKGKEGTTVTEAHEMTTVPVVNIGRPKEVAGLPSGIEAMRSEEEALNVVVIRSPMVGTFYAAPAPDQPTFVSAGKRVKEGDVLCIIEAMKLMNEIKCEIAGTVTEIMVKNGQPVEFDQPLFKIQKG